MIRPIACSFLATWLASCGSSNSGPIAPLGADLSLRVVDARTGGANGDSLAAALVLATQRAGFRADRSVLQMADGELGGVLVAMAQTHLRVNTFGAAPGPSLASSSTLVRRASESDAPLDRNGDGSNVDETLADELDRLAALVGGSLEPAFQSRLFGWRQGSADYAAAGADTDVTRPTLSPVAGEVSLAQMARAMLARTLLGTGLLQRNRGSRPGETAEQGMLGLLLLQQALAIEETMFSSLFMKDFSPGLLQFPLDYNPASGPRWLPSVVGVTVPSSGVGASSYRAVDSASTLETIAATLRAGAELSFYASDHNPNPNLRDIFRGNPFGPKPKGGAGSDQGSGDAAGQQLITWESGVSEVLRVWCVGCHSSAFPSGDFACDTYDATQRGGQFSGLGSKSPIISRGDPDRSALYYILKPKPPAPFFQMPLGGPAFPSKELELIEDWIKDGARSAPPGPPVIGRDLAVVSYKNLVALHLDASGALSERKDVDAAPIAQVDVAATGEVLQGLAAMVHLEAVLVDYRKTLQAIAEFAADHLTSEHGEVFGSFDIAAMQAGNPADLLARARLTAGMLAASRVLQDAALHDRGQAIGQQLIERFFDSNSALFRSRLGVDGRRYGPLELAAVLDALREMAQSGMVSAVSIQRQFLRRLAPVLVYSETAAAGETLGDGIADSDGDGIPEPAHAGGAFGRAPVFVGAIQEGPELPLADAPIRWTSHILPLFQGACGECHLGGASRGDYRMDTPVQLRRPGSANPGLDLVVPGDPEASYLYRKLVDRRPAAGEQMPLQTPPLSAHGKELVRQWILQGASSR